MQHRFFIVKPLQSIDPDDAYRHWTEHHLSLFAKNPGIRGYVQNRPLEHNRAAIAGAVSSETFFDNQESERASYASTYYRATVTPDEQTFLDRDSVFAAVVLRNTLLAGRTACTRVIVLGLAPENVNTKGAVGIQRYDLDRISSVYGADAPVITSLWFDDEEIAAERATRIPAFAFACRSEVVVEPPWWSIR